MTTLRQADVSWPFTTRRILVWTQDLADMDVYMRLREQGFDWIRPRNRPWEQTLRAPTVGRMVELLTRPDVRVVPIDSPAGQRLIRGLAVRT
jgi:hypothetical protein